MSDLLTGAVCLIIEVWVTSHAYDRSKLNAYAQDRVKEVWLLLVPEKQIEVHREPDGEQFKVRIIYGPGGRVTSAALPQFEVDFKIP